jgi:2-keto-4-pentenoate hydratase/2-oxohepta-3-ene-1,7-dioic acid hydratase in catechol pathway
MKLIRFTDDHGRTHHGAWDGAGTARRIDGDPFGDHTVTDEVLPVARLLAPLAAPTLLGVGLNYRRHAEESGMAAPAYPVLFVKGANTVQDPGGPIELPTHLASAKVDYECELAVVIGRAAKNVSRADALDYVYGYACANDVSARDWQLERGGGQWCRGKFFDTFTPFGPCIVTADEVPDPHALGIRTRLNGETVQDWTTGDMIFDVPTIIEFLSGSTTLLPGTVILTGTPHGVGMAATPPRWLADGDVVEIEIDGLGVLSNPVVLEPAASRA